MPRVSIPKDGQLRVLLEVRDLEHPVLFRELCRIASGARRRARLFGLIHLGIALELGRATQGTLGDDDASNSIGVGSSQEGLKLTRQELDDLFGDGSMSSAQSEDLEPGLENS